MQRYKKNQTYAKKGFIIPNYGKSSKKWNKFQNLEKVLKNVQVSKK